MKRALPAVVLAALLLAAPAASRAEPRIVDQGQAVQTGTMRYVLHSEAIGRDFLVEVTWPPTPVPPGTKLPAVYVLDAGYGLAGPAGTLLIAGGRMAPAFIVSIGYPNPIAANFGPRNDDLMHVRKVNPADGKAYGGGGRAFEDFIVKEVRPFLEARYPIDPARSILAGHSGGGLFTSVVLAERPDSFSGYVIGGLQLSIDPTLPERFRALAPIAHGQKVFVFYSPQDLQNGLQSDKIVEPLSVAGSKLEVRSKLYEDQTHLTSNVVWMADALPFLLPPTPPAPASWPPIVAVAPATLDRYVGAYEIRPGSRIVVTRSEGRLLAQVADTAPVELFATADNRFISHGVDTEATFEPDGRVSLRLRGVPMTAERVR